MSESLVNSSTSELPLDKSGTAVRDMFAGVAPRYDFLNHLLSGALDVIWRKLSAQALGDVEGRPVLDLCCGTGDQALEVEAHGGRTTAADFCVPMLALAQPKLRQPGRPAPPLLAADALALPFGRAHFGGATVSFGLRNVADLDRALAEIHRVLKPGARLAILEFALPQNRAIRSLYMSYFLNVLPRLGKLFSPRGSAYTYLPLSVIEFPQRQGFLDRMANVGFEDCAWRDLTFGTVCLYTGKATAR